MRIREYELRIEMPEGFELVGVKTDGDTAVVVCRPKDSEVRTIGFATVCEEPGTEDDEEEYGEEEDKTPVTG